MPIDITIDGEDHKLQTIVADNNGTHLLFIDDRYVLRTPKVEIGNDGSKTLKGPVEEYYVLGKKELLGSGTLKGLMTDEQFIEATILSEAERAIGEPFTENAHGFVFRWYTPVAIKVAKVIHDIFHFFGRVLPEDYGKVVELNRGVYHTGRVVEEAYEVTLTRDQYTELLDGNIIDDVHTLYTNFAAKRAELIVTDSGG